MMRQLIIAACWVCLSQGAAQAFSLDLGKLIDAGKKAGDLRPMDDKKEAETGAIAAASILGVAPLVKNDALQVYVNQLGRWLAQQTERPNLAWRFGVLDSDAINAFAAPGGYVFVTRGLLLRMRDEAELAGILAHEISHVVQRHHAKALQKNAQVGLAAGLASSFTSSSSALSAEAKNKLISVSNELYSRGLDHDDEFEADRMGVVIAARAGYDPYGLPAALQTLDAMNAQDGQLALMFKTHPAFTKRLALLDAAMSPAMDRYASAPPPAGRFEQVVGAYARGGR